MTDYTVLGEEIEREYEAYRANPAHDLNHMFALIKTYISPIIARVIREGSVLDEDAVEELSQEVLLELAEKGLARFEKKEAKFCTYCGAIAKNKAIGWVRKRFRRREELCEDFSAADRNDYRTPEWIYLEREQLMEIYEMAKRYLQLLADLTDKPYRVVANCYTLVLFPLEHPCTKELSSPGWAYGQLQEQSVCDGADGFVREFEQHVPQIPFVWGDAFLDAMDEKEDGVYVSDIIFGDRFRTKDFENWSLRLRKKLRRLLVEEEQESLGREEAYGATLDI